MPEKQVAKLLEQGLYHYGQGEIGLAVELWKQVLELDPRNEVAREYLSIELGSSWQEKITPSPKAAAPVMASVIATEPEKKSQPEEFNLAQQHLKSERAERAKILFEELCENEPGNMLYRAFFELSKVAIVKQLLVITHSFGNMPVLKVSLSKITDYQLTEEQGFILSLINGETSFEDMVYLSPVPPFVTFFSLNHFLQTGMIGLKDTEK